jgi:hypothetical protein
LHYPVARSDIVQQEVTERMDRLAAERGGHDKHAAVQNGPGQRRL